MMNTYTITCPYCEELMPLVETKLITNKSFKSYTIKLHRCRVCKSTAEVSGPIKYLNVSYRKGINLD